MTATEGVEHSDTVAIHMLLFCCRYYKIDIDTIKTYTYSRVGVLASMIQYLENPKKLPKKEQSYNFYVHSEEELDRKIIEAFGL